MKSHLCNAENRRGYGGHKDVDNESSKVKNKPASLFCYISSHALALKSYFNIKE